MVFHGNQRYVSDYRGQLANKTLRVVTLVEEPFIMLTQEPKDPLNVQDDEIEGSPVHT